MKNYALSLKALLVGILAAVLSSIYIFNYSTDELTNAEIIENSPVNIISSSPLN